jgi:small multidrug resistance family-3 protein
MSMAIAKSLFIFLLAGLCEIGGGYLIWLSIREDKPLWYGILGGIILIAYGIVATWQTDNFGRTHAAYGGIFIIMSMLWAYRFDNFIPDKYDIIGAIVALTGVCIMFFAPRK